MALMFVLALGTIWWVLIAVAVVVLVTMVAVAVVTRKKPPVKDRTAAVPADPIAPRIAHPSTLCVPAQSAPKDGDFPLTASSGDVKHDSVHLDAGSSITLQGDLTVVANNHITIDGSIAWPDSSATVWDGRTPSANLTLICPNGRVDINGIIGDPNVLAARGDDVAASGTAAVAAGRPGQPGGTVYIRAAFINVDGAIDGHRAGRGGNADATGVTTPQATGDASATGAAGAWGGDVVLCATEGITIKGRVIGGRAGSGGSATAWAAGGCLAYAESGPGGAGGSVYLHALGAQLTVDVSGKLEGGFGGVSTDAFARSSAAGTPGSDVQAKGGDGGPGGNRVLVGNVTIQGVARGGPGGNGGNAMAWAGPGDPGKQGGDAQATGGNGGPDGQGDPAVPQLWAQHKGGWASAVGGQGGDASGNTGAAWSGAGEAQGGTDAGGTPPPPDKKPSQAPNGNSGGMAQTAKSP